MLARPLALLLLMPQLLVALPARAATYTATPATLGNALGQLRAGDTLSLAAGDYSHVVLQGLAGTAQSPIVIAGPTSGTPAVIHGNACCNTIEILSSSYLVLRSLVIDNGAINGVFGISAAGELSNLVHHITVEDCTIRNFAPGDQQQDGISTKTPTWGWIIRRNRILGPGTGIYLGNSTGSDPFIAGLIEDNLIVNPVGYCMEIKWQAARPTVAGMPTDPQITIVRNNVFVKNDQPSPDGDRPNVLIDGVPESGTGASDRYEIYGNVFLHNPRESLFQGSGRLSIHDNIFVDVVGTAVELVNHDGITLKDALVYDNTIYSAGSGIHFANAASGTDAVVGNLVFATTGISGAITDVRDNIVDTTANAATYVSAPSTTPGQMDFYPRPGRCQGSPIEMTKLAGDDDYDRDFNGARREPFLFRGAYAGSGQNPGWRLSIDIKPVDGAGAADGGVAAGRDGGISDAGSGAPTDASAGNGSVGDLGNVGASPDGDAAADHRVPPSRSPVPHSGGCAMATADGGNWAVWPLLAVLLALLSVAVNARRR